MGNRGPKPGTKNPNKGRLYVPATKAMTVRLPVTLWADLQESSTEAGITRNALVRRFCEAGLKRASK